MDRRHLLAGIAALAAATPVLAQTAAPQTGSGTRSGSADATMGEAEMRHMQRTMMLGTMALETSRVAMQKAQHPNVKMFATFEVAEQETIAEVLNSMREPAATSSTGAGSASAAQPPQMDASAREMVQKLQQAQAGREFDREYIQGQIQGHQGLLQAQEEYLRSGRNREHVNVAKLARGMIKEHLALLQDIQKELGRG
jgi:putative membrane protein